jgi:hypothetical protein
MTLQINERVDDYEESMRAMLDGMMAGLQTALPGIIESFNAATQTASVLPAIKANVRKQDGSAEQAALPMLVDVPVYFPGGGGYSLTFPIAKGDECLLVFSSRCIDAWWQQSGQQPPMESRSHSLSDAIAFVGLRSKPRALAGLSAGAAQLRGDSGGTYIELSGNAVNIVAPGGITFTTPTLQVSGDVKAGTISLKTHVHLNTQPGSGQSGIPKP